MGLFTRGITYPKAFTTTGLTPIEMPLPQQVTLPLRQYMGEAAEPSVKVGDTVKVGQIIATAPGPHALPLHATISGTISAIADTLTYTGIPMPAITITGDGKDTWKRLPKPTRDIDALTTDELMAQVDAAGLITTGMFPVPLARDLMPLEQPKTHLTLDGRTIVQRIDTLMITACDPEPALGVNRFLATINTDALPVGIAALAKLTGADEIRFIVDKTSDPPAQLTALAASDETERTKITMINGRHYPAAHPAVLIKALLHREIPLPYGHPRDVGVALYDLATVIALGDVLTTGRPPISQQITVGGGAIKTGGIVTARLGTSLGDIIEAVGGFARDPAKIIVGGPMTGMAHYDLSVPLSKEATGLFALTEEEITLTVGYRQCINCGRCVAVCPVNLVPGMLSLYCAKDRFDRAEQQGVLTCIECGCCDYVCPSRRPLVHLFRYAKHQLMEG
jgi:Na+-translocating ferredoxin:NAD+ oxidoreductase subunit C